MRTTSKRTTSTANAETSCCAYVIVYLLFGLMGRWIVDYDCMVILGKHPPFLISFVVGIFGWGVAFPLMLLCWVLTACGVHTPFLRVN